MRECSVGRSVSPVWEKLMLHCWGGACSWSTPLLVELAAGAVRAAGASPGLHISVQSSQFASMRICVPIGRRRLPSLWMRCKPTSRPCASTAGKGHQGSCAMDMHGHCRLQGSSRSVLLAADRPVAVLWLHVSCREGRFRAGWASHWCLWLPRSFLIAAGGIPILDIEQQWCTLRWSARGRWAGQAGPQPSSEWQHRRWCNRCHP